MLAGLAMGRRALYMFGAIPAPGPDGTGRYRARPWGCRRRSAIWSRPTAPRAAMLTIDGLAFDFMDAGGTGGRPSSSSVILG